jgi:hypothetical protein
MPTIQQISGSYSPEHVAAFHKWQRGGSLQLDEADVRAIEREDPETGAHIRQERTKRDAEPVAKVQADASAALQRAQPATTASPLQSIQREWLKAFDEIPEGGGWSDADRDRWHEKHATLPARSLCSSSS